MRKIITDSPQYNATLPITFRPWRLVLVLILALTMGACSSENKTSEKVGSTESAGSEDCPVLIDISAWTAFQDLGQRIHTGITVTQEDLLAFGDLPTVALWRESLQPNTPSPSKVANWLEGAFWTELGRQGKQKVDADRFDFIRSYNYSFNNRDRINQKLASYAGPSLCQLDSLARYWIDPDKLPATVTLHFLPAKPEIRISGGSLFVDTGVVAAGSANQLTRQIASLMYRKHGTLPGSSPMELEGEQAVAHSFMFFMNEGIIGWIQQTMDMEFDPSHPRLNKVKIIPEEFFLTAQKTVAMMNGYLGPLLADESEISAKGYAFARLLQGMNAYGMTGYAMAAVIAGHLGEERLKEVRHSVPGFLAAYQEAALRNPNPAPVPGSLGTEVIATVPPLEPEIYAELHALLGRVFPE